MSLAVEQEKIGPCRVRLTFNVTPEHVERAERDVWKYFARTTRIDGFRKGHAPIHLVKKLYSEEDVRQYVEEGARGEAYRQALKESGLKPFSRDEPRVERLDPDEGEAGPEAPAGGSGEIIRCKAEIPISPQVTLGDPSTLTGRLEPLEVTEEQAEQEVAYFSRINGDWRRVEEPVQPGDVIEASMTFKIGGEVDEEFSFQEPRSFAVGRNLPEVDDALLGMRAGETKSFSFIFNEEWGDPERTGQTVEAEVALISVDRRLPHEINDELARRLGHDSVAQWKEAILEERRTAAKEIALNQLRGQLLDALVLRSEVEYPVEVLQDETSSRLARLMDELEKSNRSLVEYLEKQQLDMEELTMRLEWEGDQALRRTLVALELGRQQKIRVTSRDVDEELKRRAQAQGVKVGELRRTMKEEGSEAEIEDQLFYRHIGDYLISQAKVEGLPAPEAS